MVLVSLGCLLLGFRNVNHKGKLLSIAIARYNIHGRSYHFVAIHDFLGYAFMLRQFSLGNTLDFVFSGGNK